MQEFFSGQKAVFVSNLPPQMELQQLRDIFLNFGQTESIDVFPDPSNSMAMAVILYKEAQSAFQAAKLDKERIIDSEIHVVAYGPKTPLEFRSQQAQKELMRLYDLGTGTIVHIWNVSPFIDDEAIKSFFSKVGTVTKVEIIPDTSGRLACTARVEFSTPEEATAALEMTGSTLLDNEVTIVRAKSMHNSEPSSALYALAETAVDDVRASLNRATRRDYSKRRSGD
ncbi:hypothetical protein BLNAU_9198 [Blattamonas nauphoetae]|uniref:RRM domain-containing protein n=1 Tax=Blattamonas nauphoetae TaxID=2049346 RepID=A0ABQ9XWH6_9EUKA|nr:hypothetical protein BLNAU_9198 [Blattamonas nauphoetae]